MERPPLERAPNDRILAGVCAGLAVHLGAPVKHVRVATAVLGFAGGFGALLYLWLWATVPQAGESEGIVPLRRALTKPSSPGEASKPSFVSNTSGGATAGSADAAPDRTGQASAPQRAGRRRWPVAELLLGACLLFVGAGLLLDRLGVGIDLAVVLPGFAVLAGVALTWWQVADRDRPERNQVPRVLGAIALVAVGVLMFFATAREPSMWTVVAAALAVLAGVALAIAPWLLRLNRELIAERSARAREAERAEIAAHLHDSVLQTLALIQQRSEPGSEVARLARGQERELREWLFRGADGAPEQPREAIDAELRRHARELEGEHAVRFEVVTVGLGGGVVAPEAIVAAAREAMLNAARHAGGDVTVFIEAARDRLSVDVTDRGPGLDPSRLPEGRMGVRESILGRMERAGGSAAIARGPGGGASVRLSMPIERAGEAGSVPGAENGKTGEATKGDA